MVGDVGPTSMCHITVAECSSCLLQLPNSFVDTEITVYPTESKFYSVMWRQKVVSSAFETGGTLI